MPIDLQRVRQNTVSRRFYNQSQHRKNKHQQRQASKAICRAAKQSTDKASWIKQGAVIFAVALTGYAVFVLTQNMQTKSTGIKETIKGTSEALTTIKNSERISHFQADETYFNNHILRKRQEKRASNEKIYRAMAENTINSYGNNILHEILIVNARRPVAPQSELPVHQDINGRTVNAMHSVMIPTDRLEVQEEECSLSDRKKIPFGFYAAMSNPETFQSFVNTCPNSNLEELKENFPKYKKEVPAIRKSLMLSERAANSNSATLDESFELMYNMLHKNDGFVGFLQEQGVTMSLTRQGLSTPLIKKNGYYQCDDSKIDHSWVTIEDTRNNAEILLNLLINRPDMVTKELGINDINLATDVLRMAVRDLSPLTKKQYIENNLEKNYKTLCEFLEKREQSEIDIKI